MNQAKNMSLNEVHANMHDSEVQVGRESKAPRRRSMMINESAEGASITKR